MQKKKRQEEFGSPLPDQQKPGTPKSDTASFVLSKPAVSKRIQNKIAELMPGTESFDTKNRAAKREQIAAALREFDEMPKERGARKAVEEFIKTDSGLTLFVLNPGAFPELARSEREEIGSKLKEVARNLDQVLKACKEGWSKDTGIQDPGKRALNALGDENVTWILLGHSGKFAEMATALKSNFPNLAETLTGQSIYDVGEKGDRGVSELFDKYSESISRIAISLGSNANNLLNLPNVMALFDKENREEFLQKYGELCEIVSAGGSNRSNEVYSIGTALKESGNIRSLLLNEFERMKNSLQAIISSTEGLNGTLNFLSRRDFDRNCVMADAYGSNPEWFASFFSEKKDMAPDILSKANLSEFKANPAKFFFDQKASTKAMLDDFSEKEKKEFEKLSKEWSPNLYAVLLQKDIRASCVKEGKTNYGVLSQMAKTLSKIPDDGLKLLENEQVAKAFVANQNKIAGIIADLSKSDGYYRVKDFVNENASALAANPEGIAKGFKKILELYKEGSDAMGRAESVLERKGFIEKLVRDPEQTAENLTEMVKSLQKLDLYKVYPTNAIALFIDRKKEFSELLKIGGTAFLNTFANESIAGAANTNLNAFVIQLRRVSGEVGEKNAVAAFNFLGNKNVAPLFVGNSGQTADWTIRLSKAFGEKSNSKIAKMVNDKYTGGSHDALAYFFSQKPEEFVRLMEATKGAGLSYIDIPSERDKFLDDPQGYTKGVVQQEAEREAREAAKKKR